MTFKATLQALEERGVRGENYRYYTKILRFLFGKNATKFACLQTFKVTCKCA